MKTNPAAGVEGLKGKLAKYRRRDVKSSVRRWPANWADGNITRRDTCGRMKYIDEDGPTFDRCSRCALIYAAVNAISIKCVFRTWTPERGKSRGSARLLPRGRGTAWPVPLSTKFDAASLQINYTAVIPLRITGDDRCRSVASETQLAASFLIESDENLRRQPLSSSIGILIFLSVF